MAEAIIFTESTKKTTEDTIISSHPYMVEDDVIVVARPLDDTSDLPQNLYRIRSKKTQFIK